jgi:hypothetical protein
MSRTTFSGPIKAGDIKYNTYKDVGTVPLNQNVLFDFSAGDTVTTTKTLYLPAGSRITSIQALVLVVYNAVTTNNVTIGKAAAGNEYVTTFPVGVAGLITPTTPTVAQALNWDNTTTAGADISSSVTGSFPVSPLFVTLGLTGTAATTGKCRITIQYTQPDDRATTFTQ